MAGLGEKIVGSLFSFMLIITLFSLTFVQISNYDTLISLVENGIKDQDIVPDSFDESSFPEFKDSLLADCSESGNDFAQIKLETEETVELNCQRVTVLNNSHDLFSLITLEMFKMEYNKEHDCNFFSCFFNAESDEDRINYLVSYDAHTFYEKSYWFIIGATVFLALIFVYFSGGFFSFSRNLGWIYVFMGIGFIVTELFKRVNLSSLALTKTMGSTLPILTGITDTMQRYLIIYFIAGVVLLGIGYGGNMISTKIRSGKGHVIESKTSSFTKNKRKK